VSEDFQQAPKQQALGNNLHIGNTMPTMKSNVANPGSTACTKPSWLTDDEHSLLHKHQGCIKCHHGYQTHHASDCPFNFSDPHNYKELTDECLLSFNCGGSGNGKSIGIIMPSRIKESEDAESSLVGAVMPSGILGASSELEDDVSASLTMKHLHWLCSLLGPLINEPLTVEGMLDCGAHVILINKTLVTLLSLHRFR
jgi:hypothetical protein